MASVPSASHQLAILGGEPAFPPEYSVPLIHPKGYGPRGDFSVIDAILCNEPNDDSKARASRQRFVSKNLPGIKGSLTGYRVQLQNRIGDFLKIDFNTSSVICVTSGTNALRSVLKAIRPPAQTADSSLTSEVIVPQTTVGATIEAIIAESFRPIFVAVSPDSWLLDPEAAERAITDRTAAILTVDWLGTQCNLEPFRELANKYQIKLISDSAQSFGANSGGNQHPPAADLAHATIYSLGYPKVFTGAGYGGVIVCPKSLMSLLKRDATGILRHETLPEANAFACLRALEALPNALAIRAAAGNMYRKLLSGVPGIFFQGIPDGMSTNHYQISFRIEAQAFGLSAKQLCQVLMAENVHCSADRMPCVATSSIFHPYGRVEGDIKHSQMLAASSVTLPISNDINLNDVETICHLIALANYNAQEIISTGFIKTVNGARLRINHTSEDLESKFRNQLIVPVLDGASVHSKIIVPHELLLKRSISVDELLEKFMERKQWRRGDDIVRDLVVDAVVDDNAFVILAPKRGSTSPATAGEPIPLDESGSLASVTLVPCADGKLIVRKSATGYGIDGNGAPWLRRQSLFLNNSTAVKKTGMFVVPSSVNDLGDCVALELPYIASHLFGELAFANVGAQPLIAAITDVLVRMAGSVWTEGQIQAEDQFIEKAHLSRMRRRLQIARKEDSALDQILSQHTVMLNGKQLLGFEDIMEKLESHPRLAEIQPTVLSEIHGDLNIHNILSPLSPNDHQKVALIDPRGVPLLDSNSNTFERGDYGYDISKLLFSLTGFSDIRRRLFNYSVDGKSHSVMFEPHPGSNTMNEAAHLLIPALTSNQVMRQWIERVENQGVESFEIRVRLGEAAHFVADCACALGRNTPWEIVPLFLIGLEKLNSVVDLLEGRGQLLANGQDLTDSVSVPLGANFGATMIQKALFDLQTSPKRLWPYDLLEVSVKVESMVTVRKLLRDMVGTYLPKHTPVLLSIDPLEDGRLAANYPPCLVLIHPSDGTRGQTHMFAAAARRTVSFLRDNALDQSAIDCLRIVHISSTGSSSRSQFTARCNDKLASPGSFGISPLQLAVMQSLQLPFPKPGRWVVENDSFFLLSKSLAMSGDHLCLLVLERPTSGSTLSWRVRIDKTEKTLEGLLVAKSFCDIGPDEKGKKLLRTTTGMFVPHRLAEAISLRQDDYLTRTSPLLSDLVLPRFMDRIEWIKLCHRQGYGVNSHLAWRNTETFKAACSELVELSSGGDQVQFYHFGSDQEYSQLLASISKNACLNSLAYVSAAVKWLQNTKLRTVAEEEFEDPK